MHEGKEEVPARLLADFADYCLYLSSDNIIEQRFSMEHFVKSGLTDRIFTLNNSQLKQLENLLSQRQGSAASQAHLIKTKIENNFLK